eukprot:754770-Hanusia_phi.AAC.4
MHSCPALSSRFIRGGLCLKWSPIKHGDIAKEDFAHVQDQERERQALLQTSRAMEKIRNRIGRREGVRTE